MPSRCSCPGGRVDRLERHAQQLELACLRGITGAVVQLVRIVSEIVCVLSQKRETPPDSQLCPQIIAP